MGIYEQRTDLAAEARDAEGLGDIEGVSFSAYERGGFRCERVDVSAKGTQKIGKPAGRYDTLNISALLRRESTSFGAAVETLAGLLRETLPRRDGDACTLVVGLGNRDITPDNIGPLSAQSILVTRHLKSEAPEDFKMLSPVALITPGVMGTSGIESADYIRWVCAQLRPAQVIVIDALAARSLDRLCRTIQVTDTGITPGSGVGNARSEISARTLGLPVTAIGVPTVVDVGTILASCGCSASSDKQAQMIVTPRNIDSEVSCTAKLVGYAVNLALHEGLTIEDVDMLVG